MSDAPLPKAARSGETAFRERRIVVLLAVIEVLWIAGLIYGLSRIL